VKIDTSDQILPVSLLEYAEPEDVTHYTCCDDDTAMCGEDVSQERWLGDEEEPSSSCLICESVIQQKLSCTIDRCPFGYYQDR